MADEQLYYVQDTRSYVGNCVLWWGKDRRGYVCCIDEAGLYTADEVRGMRPTEIGWPREVVERNAKRFVDHQDLRSVPDDSLIRGGVK